MPRSFHSQLRRRLSVLRLAGTSVRVRFLSRRPRPLPRSAVLLSRRTNAAGPHTASCWSGPHAGFYRIYWSDSGTFDLDARSERVDCFPLPRPSFTGIEEVLRGPVCSLFLLERGFEPLHAGAVVCEGRAVAFVGAPAAGKSSLVAWLCTHGEGFLSDDLLPLRVYGGKVRAHVGLPQMRLAPATVNALTGGREVMWQTRFKATVPVSGASRASYPLARIYLLDRRGPRAKVRLAKVFPRDAFLAFVRHSFIAVQDADWRLERQLRVFGSLAAQVPVRRLTYPSGFSRLEGVWREVRRDLDA